jgi:hypothetical protein
MRMRNVVLMVVLPALVLTGPATAGWYVTPNVDSEGIWGALPEYEHQDRWSGPWARVQSVEFDLDPGVEEYTVWVELDMGRIMVVPGRPDRGPGGEDEGEEGDQEGAEAGCESFNWFVDDVHPWATAPAGGPLPCEHQVLTGGFHRTEMVCRTGIDCITDAMKNEGNRFLIHCWFVGNGDDGHPDWDSMMMGVCSYSAIGSPPSVWDEWDSICGYSWPIGFSSCLHYSW